jgi:hypothetical protein
MNEELFGLLGGDPDAINQQAKMSGLLNFAANLLQASGPSRTPQSLGANIGAALPGYAQGYQSTIDSTLKNLAMRQKLSEEQRKRETERKLAELTPSLFAAQRGPIPTTGSFDAGQGLDVMQGGEGAVQQPPITGYSLNTSMLPALAALGPQGMDYAKNLAEFQRALSPKISVQTIYDDKGRELKVRYNEDTGTYEPLGGAKAEPFVQVDRGNVIELRRPTTGEVVGTLPKGVAPTAPSDQFSKASEGERVSSGFYMRMSDASKTFAKPLTGADGKPLVKNDKIVTLEDVASKPEIFAEIVGGIIPNWMGGQAIKNTVTSELRQQYEQAQENWVTANLRKESGAVIGVEEMQKEIRKWFPVVGNPDSVIEQKRQARKVAEESMRRNAGRALSVEPQQRNVEVPY